MLSPLSNLYLALQNTIAALADTGGNPYFRYIDQDLGQFDNPRPDNRPPVLYPCALIDIEEMHYANVADNCQQGKGSITIRLGFPPFSAGSSATPETYKEKALYYYELEQILHLALQGAHPVLLDTTGKNILANIFGAYNRTSATTQRRKDALRVRELTYQIAYDDYSTQPTTQILPAALDLTTEFPS